MKWKDFQPSERHIKIREYGYIEKKVPPLYSLLSVPLLLLL